MNGYYIYQHKYFPAATLLLATLFQKESYKDSSIFLFDQKLVELVRHNNPSTSSTYQEDSEENLKIRKNNLAFILTKCQDS